MKKTDKPKKPRPNSYDEKLAIKGDFLEVFKVVKKHKEQNAQKDKKDKKS